MRTRLLLLLVMLSVCSILSAQLPRNCSLAGRVLTDEGLPLASSVTAYRLDVQKGVVVPTDECSTISTANGEFQCSNLPRGAYLIVVTLPRSSTRADQSSEENAPVRLPAFAIYPRDLGLEDFGLLHLVTGQTKWAYITVNTLPNPDITIRQIAGAKRGHIQLSLHDDGFDVPLNIQGTDAGPDYILKDLPAGGYRVDQVWFSKGFERKATAFFSANGNTPLNVVTRKIKMYTISGVVRYPNAAHFESPTLVLNRYAGDRVLRYTALVHNDGSFTFRHVAAGDYHVFFDLKDHLKVSHLRVNGVSARNVEVDSSMIPQVLTLDADYATGSISGAVELSGSEPKPGVLIQAVNSHASMIVPIGPRGEFTIRGLPPGEYLLYGWSNIESVPYEEPRFMSRYFQKAVEVNVNGNLYVGGIEVDCNDSTL